MMAFRTSKVYLTIILLLNFGYLSFIGFQLQSDNSCFAPGRTLAISRSLSRQAESITTSDLSENRTRNSSTDRDDAEQKIWVFTDDNLEKIYFYNRLLKKEHSFNKANLKTFRDKLFGVVGDDFNNYLVVHRGNTANNSQLQYNGSKKLRFNVTDKVYQRLPHNFTVKEYERCSVVGNSGAIRQSRCGQDIDKADFVYRCNAAPIRQFVKDAGEKTNITSFNPSILGKRYHRLTHNDSLTLFLRDMKEYYGIVWASCFSFKAYTTECIQVLCNYTNTENQFVLAHPDHFRRVQRFWRSQGFKKRLTSGFYLATAALSHCREVHLYGFWPFTHKSGSTFERLSYHYYDNMSYNTASSKGPHGMMTEFAILVQFHLRGILKLHAGEC